MSKKLEKVLEYLINNQEDKAKELLHQVFIEKARAIHEELINMDEEEMDEMGGDMGEDFHRDVRHDGEELDELSDEINAEETMAEDEELDVEDAEGDLGDELGAGDEDMMDMDDTGADMDAGMDAGMGGEEPVGGEPAGEMGGVEDKMEDLEDALAALKAEFEALEKGEEAGEEAGEEDFEAGEEAGEEGAEEAGEEGEEEEMDESWVEEFDDLEESMDLEKVAADHGPEVGAGKFSSDVGRNAKSPTAKAPEAMFGAKPVKTGQGPTKSGFERESAPSAEQLKGMKADNRRKKSTDGTNSVSKEGDGSAMLNKKIGAEGTKSPLSSSPRK